MVEECKESASPSCTSEQLAELRLKYNINGIMQEVLNLQEQSTQLLQQLSEPSQLLTGKAAVEQSKKLSEINAINASIANKQSQLNVANSLLKEECRALGLDAEYARTLASIKEMQQNPVQIKKILQDQCAVFGNSYLDTNNKCYCLPGYILNAQANLCITYTEACVNSFGSNVSGIVDSNDSSRASCQCNSGFEWNDKKQCVPQVTRLHSCSVYGDGSYLGTDNKCYCKNGFEWSEENKLCVQTMYSKPETSKQKNNLPLVYSKRRYPSL